VASATKTRLRFHCVTVVGGPNACPAAKEVALVRMLSADAPRLPLKNCDRPAQCACKYRHHDDRRQGPRRAVEDTGLRKPWEERERRRVRGRRDSDFEEQF
jgi:hypothetical protein